MTFAPVTLNTNQTINVVVNPLGEGLLRDGIDRVLSEFYWSSSEVKSRVLLSGSMFASLSTCSERFLPTPCEARWGD